MNTILIEKASPKDFNRINELYYLLGSQPSDLRDMEQVFQTFENNSDYNLIVLKINNYVVATGLGVVVKSLANNCAPYFVIDNVAVDKDYQRQGLGTMLFEELHRLARNNNCCLSYLVADFDNYNAHRFYEKLGYIDKVVGFQKHL